MNRIFIIFKAFLALILILSCSSTTNTKDTKNDTLSNNTVGQPASKVFGINGEDIVIRTAPGEKSKKVINEKATQAVGETQYCEVDYSTKVEVLETNEDGQK